MIRFIPILADSYFHLITICVLTNIQHTLEDYWIRLFLVLICQDQVHCTLLSSFLQQFL